ncbi:hypothetical protein C8R43DRAFT_640005 [Mycena crocata]|nr:hypothetical protein C8R43DRAFT_640005 [Mycena crocata]
MSSGPIGKNQVVSPEFSKHLVLFDRTVDNIRRHIEDVTRRSQLFPTYRRMRSCGHLKSELEDHLETLLHLLAQPASSTAPQSQCIMEVLNLAARTSAAICDAPMLNFLKPVFNLTAIICETAKTVKSNREAAIDLAEHANRVTHCIIDRVSVGERPKAFRVLNSTLEEIRVYLASLQKRRRMSRWITASEQKDRFTELNRALDQALSLFSTTTTLAVHEELQANATEIRSVGCSVRRIDEKLTRTLTLLERNSHVTNSADVICAVQHPLQLQIPTPLQSFFFLIGQPLDW